MKTKKFLTLSASFFFLLSFIAGTQISKAATVYQCPSTGTNYNDNATCSSNCIQSANCNLNPVSASGTADGLNDAGAGAKLVGNGSQICFWEDVGNNAKTTNVGCLNLSGATASGTADGLIASGCGAKLVGNGSQICLWEDVGNNDKTTNVGCLNLSGATASGTADGLNASGCGAKLVGNGSQICLWGDVGNNDKTTNVGCLNLASTSYACPLSGGSSCLGNPETCSASQSCTAITVTNGNCGSSNGQTLASAPSTNLCSLGKASGVTGSGPWSWSCLGNGGSTAPCSALKTGSCGTSNGQYFTSAPSSNLCSSGDTASVVSGTGPWSWTCNGTSCSAKKEYSCSNVCSNLYSYASSTFMSSNSTCTAPIGTVTYSLSCACGAKSSDLFKYAPSCASACVSTGCAAANTICSGQAYFDNCGNSCGVGSKVVAAPKLNSFTVTPASITSGNSTTLSWTTVNASSCGLYTNGTWTNWIANIGGSQNVSPSDNTTYGVNCWNSCGASTGIKNVSVSVVSSASCPPSCPNPATKCLGQSLGSDGCGNTCPGSGTNTSGMCCVDTSWTPAENTQCSGTNFTQTSNCGRTQSASGTMICNGSSSGGPNPGWIEVAP